MYKVLHYNQQGFVTGNKNVCSLVSLRTEELDFSCLLMDV